MLYCIIPARSGSKGLVGKNIKKLHGKPLLAYTVEAAIKSKLFLRENIIVSTDSEEYAEIAKKFGANVSIRKKEYATDFSTTADLLGSLLKEFEDIRDFVLLQPTSPFRDENDIKRAWNLYEQSDGPVISVRELAVSSKLLTRVTDSGQIKDIVGIDKGYTRQADDTELLYYPNGAIYISSREIFEKEFSFYIASTKVYKMSIFNSIDIDDLEDFKYAEYLLSQKKIHLEGQND